MPQTDPFHALTPDRKLSDTELARAIRLNIEAELDAINLYAAHADATDNADAKAILAHVMDEEREHAALFLELIYRLDPAQKQHVDEASGKFRMIVSGAPKEQVELAGNGAHGTPADIAHPPSLTVGSLSRK